MANILKKAAAGLLEMMLTPAYVTDVRAWQSAPSSYEVDVYLPTVDMGKWNTIKRFKCKVDALEYRDYTPALWNAESNVCTLYIEAGHTLSDCLAKRWEHQRLRLEKPIN